MKSKSIRKAWTLTRRNAGEVAAAIKKAVDGKEIQVTKLEVPKGLCIQESGARIESVESETEWPNSLWIYIKISGTNTIETNDMGITRDSKALVTITEHLVICNFVDAIDEEVNWTFRY